MARTLKAETKSAKIDKTLYDLITIKVKESTGIKPVIGDFINDAIKEKLDKMPSVKKQTGR